MCYEFEAFYWARVAEEEMKKKEEERKRKEKAPTFEPAKAPKPVDEEEPVPV